MARRCYQMETEWHISHFFLLIATILVHVTPGRGPHGPRWQGLGGQALTRLEIYSGAEVSKSDDALRGK